MCERQMVFVMGGGSDVMDSSTDTKVKGSEEHTAGPSRLDSNNARERSCTGFCTGDI